MEREKEKHDVREKHRLVAFLMYPNWGSNHNPGICPDWELNWRHFALQEDAQCQGSI